MRMFRIALIAFASCTAAADTEWDFDASESRLELVHEDGARVWGYEFFKIDGMFEPWRGIAYPPEEAGAEVIG